MTPIFSEWEIKKLKENRSRLCAGYSTNVRAGKPHKCEQGIYPSCQIEGRVPFILQSTFVPLGVAAVDAETI